MKESFILLNNNMRKFYTKATTLFWILFTTQIMTIMLIIYIYVENEKSNYHYYMNTKTSLEKIHNIKIDSYDGNPERELTTEEKIYRKNSRHWHLKYLFL